MGLEYVSEDFLEFMSDVKSASAGDVFSFPTPFPRMGLEFNLTSHTYTLIMGQPGGGKTSLADFMYILSLWSFLKTNEIDEDVHWEVIYFSLERSRKFKIAKWTSWMIYRDHNYLIPPLSMLGKSGSKTGTLNQKGLDLVESYAEEVTSLLEHVNIYDGKQTLEKVKEIVSERALALGDIYTSNSSQVFKYTHKSPEPELVGSFSKEVVRKTSKGDEMYMELTDSLGLTFKITKNKKVYRPFKKKQFVYIIVDGINLFINKETIDAISVFLADARDIFGFSPVVVSQQNRSIHDTSRKKFYGGDLSPKMSDAYGSSQMSFDCDVCIGAFDPLDSYSLDANGFFGGYDIENGMTTDTGINRFRSLHLLKTSFGAAGKAYGVKFLGEVGHFEELPPSTDVEKLFEIYRVIYNGM